MIKSYFNIGWRNMLRNKAYSFINISGLAAGLAVAMLIGLWVRDELTFDRYHKNYDRIARVWVNHNFNGTISSQWSLPYPVAGELRTQFPDFEYVSIASWSYNHFIARGEDHFSKEGMFVDPEFLRLTSLKMIHGDPDALKDPHAIVLNESLAKAFFGNDNPIGKDLTIDVSYPVVVAGVYEDIPANNYFAGPQWLGNISMYMTEYIRNQKALTHWGDYSYQAFVRLRDGVDIEQSSERIRGLIVKNNPTFHSKPTMFLQPMSRWHLYSQYENGVNVGGDITFVWLFGTIGIFVLLLACINFMNLSTARSESRAKEIGLRKTIGSHRGQLILQFLTESILVVSIAFVMAIATVALSLDLFNEWTRKDIHIPFEEPMFWTTGVAMIFVTGLVAGSYPAFLLSGFNTVSILKGTFRLGWFSGFSRKILVVIQFVVSVTLVIGTLTVYQQIQYARNRPIGYDKDGLITTYGYPFNDHNQNPNIYDALRQELLNTGAVVNMGKSSSPTTNIHSYQSDFNWNGRDPQVTPNFGVVSCSHDYGNTIGIEILEGRDFSRQFASDTAALVINEAALEYMNLEDPVGQVITFNNKPFTIIGVMRNMLTESPYAPSGPLVHMINYSNSNIITMKLNPGQGRLENLAAIESVFKKFRPDVTFEAQFTDDQFDHKFHNEERLAGLALAFTVFAIIISCLGMFGLASFMAQRRTREIGIRKVSGATVFNLWSMLSRDFVLLVVISCLVASPISWMIMQQWLGQFTYHTPLSVWMFVLAGLGAVTLTLITVSYQAIRAAKANPVNSLRSE